MALYRIHNDTFEPIGMTRFADGDLREREHLQRMLREQIGIIVPNAMVLTEEFSDWESKRRIDLLCLDEDANLVVVELKRGEDGGHMELQALRYAAMLSHMSFPRAVETHQTYLDRLGSEADAEERILDFLTWDEPSEDDFARDTRVVLVAADFSTEITATVLWLNQRQLDVRCVRLFPHAMGDETLVWVEQIIPLPQAELYQIRMQEKTVGVLRERSRRRAFTGYWFVNIGEYDGPDNRRSWTDARTHGFLSAGGNSVRQIAELKVGDRVLAYRKRYGYVGAGVVTQEATAWDEFRVSDAPIDELPLEQRPGLQGPDPERGEHCLGIRWLHTREREDAVKADYRRPTACKIWDRDLVDRVLQGFGLDDADWPD
ncbi:MAG: hypothetical protein AAF138_02700 [Planctomycetota bacterium]